ncbi:MAG TPA: cytochrome b N-terminal domain-containing protein [Desulfuromonadaceae bacterium]
MLGKFATMLEERFTFKEWFQRDVLDHPVPNGLNFTYCFGGITFLLFVLLAVTGVAMLFFYVPTVDHAFASVEYITFDLPAGNVIRGIHHWSANLIIVFICLHMVRVVVYGAYKNPREFHWISGVFLFAVTLGFGFTGYLLPWDQKAYWATKVGVSMPKSIPVAGDLIVNFLMGGSDIGALTISRFFALHVAVLPLVTVAFLIAHFLMIRRTGVAQPL